TVATWGPSVLAHTDRQVANLPPQSVERFLMPLSERATDLGLDRLRFVERRRYRLECNWKVFVDNYLDGGYHVTTVHPELAGVLDYTKYRTEVLGQTSVQISPLVRKDDADPAVQGVRGGDNAYYWWVFPNLMLN